MMTTMVGLSRLLCEQVRKENHGERLSAPCVCQKTPPLPSFADSPSTHLIALLTAKY